MSGSVSWPLGPLLSSFAGWRPRHLGADLAAGLTLAAIAIPEQMATAKLAGFAPEIGLLALMSGGVGFALFGANRILSVGADSTIAPIFAGALASLSVSGSADYAQNAAALALGVGIAVGLAGILRLGFVANLLSMPVTTGFLAGISVHIVASQAPAILGIETPPGSTVEQLIEIAKAAPHANLLTVVLGLGVFAAMQIGESLSPRIPSALIAVLAGTAATAAFGLEAHGVSTLGVLPSVAPHLVVPEISFAVLRQIAPLVLIVAAVVMMQTAATTRSFSDDPGSGLNQDFLGVGAANVLAGLTGAFPVNASPPRTAIVSATGGVSQLGALFAAALALALALFGGQLIAHVPHAALAGVLLFVAGRILRFEAMVDVWRRTGPEFALILVTWVAIVVLPIEQGVGLGIMMSILHGVWTTTRARLVEFVRIPGASIWWPKSATSGGETVAGIRVVALQAPLSFLNAYQFQHSLKAIAAPGVKLVVIEANAIVEIDYTAAKTLGDAITALRAAGVEVAFARLESLRAQRSFVRLGLQSLVGADRVFHSVDEAIRKLAPRRRDLTWFCLSKGLAVQQQEVSMNPADLFPGFASRRIALDGLALHARIGGEGPPLVLLHGYPQSHLMWRKMAPELAKRFTVVAPDLRGYGWSDAPASENGEGYTKRVMGKDVVGADGALGFPRFSIAGHDRGGRVAYRLALDAPERIEKIAVLDIVPTGVMWSGMDAKRAMQVYHWLFLAQPSPLPESLIGSNAQVYIDHTLASWTATKSLDSFEDALPAYRAACADPLRLHAMCEDYRAGATFDRQADDADLPRAARSRRRMLALWGAVGIPAAGASPLDVWKRWASDVRGHAIQGGHFLPEEAPEATLQALQRFLLTSKESSACDMPIAAVRACRPRSAAAGAQEAPKPAPGPRQDQPHHRPLSGEPQLRQSLWAVPGRRWRRQCERDRRDPGRQGRQAL